MALPFQKKPSVLHKSPVTPPPEKKLSKPDFFGSSGSLTRGEFREKLRKAAPGIPDSSKWMTRDKRVAIEKKIGYGKYGSDISRKDVRGAIGDFQQEKGKVKTDEERQEIDRTIRWLKKETGTS